MDILPEGNGNNWKNSKFELKFEKNWPYHQREMKKIEIRHENLNEKIWKFSFLKFEMK
jgi:hypothetical protein